MKHQVNYIIHNIFQITYTLVRNGAGLGINIAGGKGSTPYRDNDEVDGRYFDIFSDIIRFISKTILSLFQGVFISKINEIGPVGRDGILQPGDKLISVSVCLFMWLLVWVFIRQHACDLAQAG